MTERIRSLTIAHGELRMDVSPEIVLEVSFDSIQRSDRHSSGYALRFPRIKRIRYDKSPREIDDIATVEEILKLRG